MKLHPFSKETDMDPPSQEPWLGPTSAEVALERAAQELRATLKALAGPGG